MTVRQESRKTVDKQSVPIRFEIAPAGIIIQIVEHRAKSLFAQPLRHLDLVIGNELYLFARFLPRDEAVYELRTQRVFEIEGVFILRVLNIIFSQGRFDIMGYHFLLHFVVGLFDRKKYAAPASGGCGTVIKFSKKYTIR